MNREQPAEPRAIPPHNGSMALPASVLGQPVDVDYHWDGEKASVEDVTVEGVSIHAILDGMYSVANHGSRVWAFWIIEQAICERIGEEWDACHDK